jgi:hypothetical protein
LVLRSSKLIVFIGCIGAVIERERMKQETLIVRRKADQLPRNLVLRLSEMLKTVHFGTLTLIIKEGRLVQIDKKDLVRLNQR